MFIQDFMTAEKRLKQFRPSKKGDLAMDMEAIIMLILQLNTGQFISIGKNIQIIVLGNSKGIIRLGIKAPLGIRINQDEIHYKVQSRIMDSEHE